MLLDLVHLKCPLPALRTRKALRTLKAGETLEVHCTDPLAVIDIPNVVREEGDMLQSSVKQDGRLVFVIVKAERKSNA